MAWPLWRECTDKSVKEVAGLFLVSRLLILAAAYLSSLVVAHGQWFENTLKNYSALGLFFRWDSYWYWSVVSSGYKYQAGQITNLSFFPLYPAIIYVFSNLTRDLGTLALIGYAVSNLAFFLACVYLHKLVGMDFHDPTPYKAVAYLLIFPASFFFSIFYPEGVFLLLAISSVYYARKKRWLLCSALGFFLSLTKTFGVIIVIPLLAEYLGLGDRLDFKAIKRPGKDILYLLLPPLGLLTYMGYQAVRFGDALAFYKILQLRGRHFSSLTTTLETVTSHNPFYKITYLSLAALAVLLVVYLLYRRVRISYLLYSTTLMSIYLFTNTLDSIPRHLGLVFPIFISMALLTGKRPLLEQLFAGGSLMLLTIYTILFVNGYWLT